MRGIYAYLIDRKKTEVKIFLIITVNKMLRIAAEMHISSDCLCVVPK
jgi:hypothetical protein